MEIKPFSEVIESSLYSWLIQSWQWNITPAFGSLIIIEHQDKQLCGIVHQIQTGSMDPIRYPFPFKKTQEELLKEQPQIFEFLKTTFTCLPLGYLQKGKAYYLLPEQPPAIHAFASLMPQELSRQFFFNNSYLQVLFSAGQNIGNLDELLLALFKQQTLLKILTPEKIQEIMQTYCLLIGNDYRRLKLFSSRVQTII